MNRRRNQRAQFDVIIVGGGPAGLSAAITLARCRRRVLLCDAGHPRNVASHGVHNFLTREGIKPLDLLNLGRRDALAYGAQIIRQEVVRASCARSRLCTIQLSDGRNFKGRKLILATGVRDMVPDIPGLRELYGKSVHHCPYCDGWEYRDKPLAVIGDPRQATGLALSLLTWSRDLVVCTNAVGRVVSADHSRLTRLDVPIRTDRIQRLETRRGRLQRIIFESGPPLSRAGAFFCSAQRQHSPLVQALGCKLDEKGMVICDRKGRTGVPNLFLAGDANGDVQFAIVAAGEGATAGVAINRELQEEDRARQSPVTRSTSSAI